MIHGLAVRRLKVVEVSVAVMLSWEKRAEVTLSRCGVWVGLLLDVSELAVFGFEMREMAVVARPRSISELLPQTQQSRAGPRPKIARAMPSSGAAPPLHRYRYEIRMLMKMTQEV